MKNDLVSRKAIKEYINQSDLTNREKMTLHIAINNIPATAAAPEVHGKWVGYDVSYWRYSHGGGYPVNLIRYRCSVCGRTVCKKEPYCHCGAKMDGGEGK